MKIIKNNNKNRMTQLKQFNIALITVPLLFINSITCHAEDLLSGTDLQDSPLSLSLTTTLAITINNSVQHLAISQYGIKNQVTVNQMANMINEINIIQSGINNKANLVQSGSYNTVNLLQQGDGNLAEVIQEGDANIANIKQAGEQTFIVHQIGNEMLVNITQY
ncbi:curlin subunit CsgB [Pseudoalteromonas denitrificans]|uniref:Minor curlin subunit n=1 Tax=Pseudoalteromonas denitrificans DSM 6059 TaxID=1123010 RepID=A0A1I1UGV5_9GAMM|nr:curlin subunit CsgB [Pseudoalteromonas denitrificans]SFD70076.1 minor curlin subunit [Pseudoalteromonas denitrificans DSM 6059]